MKVTADVRRSDLLWFNLAIIPKTRSTYMATLFIAALVFIFIVWERGLPQSGNDWLATVAASIGGGIGGMFAGIVISFSFILLSSSAKNGVLGKHEYRIGPEGLYEKTTAHEGLRKWEGIQEVQTAGNYLLYRISGYLFHIVPYRSFPSEEARKDFASASIQYWKNAHNK